MDNYIRYLIDQTIQSNNGSSTSTNTMDTSSEASANLQYSSDSSEWTIDKTYEELDIMYTKGILTGLNWHREDGSIVRVPFSSKSVVDGKNAFVFSTILTTADGSTFHAFILDEDDVLTYVTEDIGGGGGGGGIDTSFKVVGLNDQGKPDVVSPSEKIIYLTKDASSTATDPYTEWIYTDNDWQIIGETSVDLDDYAKKEDLDDYATKTDIANKPDVSGDHLGGQLASFLPDNNLMGSGIYASDVATKNDLSGKLDTLKHPQANEIPIITASGQLESSSKSINDVVFQDDLNGYKPKQTAVVDPVASGNAVSFIDSITQDANGVISATKKTPPLVTQNNTAGFMSSEDKTKLDGIESHAEANVQSNWGETNPSSAAYIVNKPGLATTSVAGLMSQSDKEKLDGIALGAEVNTIESISVNGVPQTPDANRNVDLTITVTGGVQGVKLDGAQSPLTPDASDIVTIPNAVSADSQNATNGLMTASDKQKLNGISTGANKVEASTTPGDGNIRVDGSSVSVYVHPTTAGNKHVPAGGSEYDILCYGGSSGTVAWSTDTTNIYTIHEIEPLIPTVTIGGRVYNIVQIGNQYWLAENLDYKFDGCTIAASGTPRTPAAWYYSNNESTYGWDGYRCGLLYNHYAVMYLEENKAILLPSGWRIPSEDDWDALISATGDIENAGTMLKASNVSWAPNWYGTDDFGMNIIPTGERDDEAYFDMRLNTTCFWTTHIGEDNTSYAWQKVIAYNVTTVGRRLPSRVYGGPLRLVKDAI